MLVLSRKLGEKIVIGDNIVVTVVKIDRNQIRIGIEAPQEVPGKLRGIGRGADRKRGPRSVKRDFGRSTVFELGDSQRAQKPMPNLRQEMKPKTNYLEK